MATDENTYLETDSRYIRYPTAQERNELIEYQADLLSVDRTTNEDREEAKALIERASIAVFPHYATDGPGYAGPVMVVIYGVMETARLYIWDKNKKLVKIEPEYP